MFKPFPVCRTNPFLSQGSLRILNLMVWWLNTRSLLLLVLLWLVTQVLFIQLLLFSFGQEFAPVVVTRSWVPFSCPALVRSIWSAFHLFCIGALLSVDRHSPPPPQDWILPLRPCYSASLTQTTCIYVVTPIDFLFLHSPVLCPVIHCWDAQLLTSVLSWLMSFWIISLGTLLISYILVFGFGQHQISLTLEYLIDI